MKYTTLDKMTETERQAYDEMGFDAQMEYDSKLLEQEVKAYVREYNRLLKKYGYNEKITAEDVTNKPYFFDDDSETLICTGGKEMAQYNGFNGGLWGDNEVKMWE